MIFTSGKGECMFSLKRSAAMTKLAYILMQSKIHKQNLHETQQSYKCQFEVNNGAIDGAYRKATCQYLTLPRIPVVVSEPLERKDGKDLEQIGNSQ